MTGKIDARPATDAERPVVERLIQLYLHDMTEFNPFPIGTDGLYEYAMLDQFWQRPYLIYSDDEIAGFALVIEQCPITGVAPCYFMAELFVLKPYRRRGFATAVCLGIFADHPGLWHVGVIERNATAAAFWRHFFDPFEVRTNHHNHDGESWLVYEFES
jgi:predicted acetyltransferase